MKSLNFECRGSCKLFTIPAVTYCIGKTPYLGALFSADPLQRLSDLLRLLPAQSLRRVQLFATPWTVASQAPLSMGIPQQEYWSGLPFPPPRVFLTQGSNQCLLWLPNCRQILHHRSHWGSPLYLRWASRKVVEEKKNFPTDWESQLYKCAFHYTSNLKLHLISPNLSLDNIFSEAKHIC